jgi:hypothetical protein
MSQWNDQRRGLVQTLQNIGGAGRAEGERQERIAFGFYPVTEHLRLLDPEVVLVVGPRGSGKTEIARVLADADLYKAVSRHAPAVRLPSGHSKWTAAHPSGAEGFEVVGLRSFMQSRGSDTETLRDLWFAYLVRTLGNELNVEEKSGLDGLVQPQGADINGIATAFAGLATRPVVALDRLDARLSSEDRYVFVTYDELDTLGAGDWTLIEAGVRGLVAFWAAYARRWKRIRAKLFLRTDLYERHARAGGADLAKLAAGRVDLAWNDRDLYGLLLKRLANLDPELARYVQSVKGIEWVEDPELGKIPRLRKWQDARPVVERMVGAYMGANQKKGLVYRWLIDHVRDGLSRALPRPFVRLIEEAARQEIAHFGSLREPRLLEPASLRRALDRVSNDHVAQSLDEWPWLDSVKARLAESALVPWDRERDVVKLLEGFTGAVGSSAPPYEGRELLEYLLEIGILRRRPDGRVDAPDLFLSGLGLRRKGGVRKRG